MFTRLAQLAFLGLIHTYRHTLGYFMGGQCRYQPTCSVYGLEAIRAWGPWRGGWMTLRRIGRCHPFVQGGFDPAPENPERPQPQAPRAENHTQAMAPLGEKA